jgi:hypothetical protein
VGLAVIDEEQIPPPDLLGAPVYRMSARPRGGVDEFNEFVCVRRLGMLFSAPLGSDDDPVPSLKIINAHLFPPRSFFFFNCITFFKKTYFIDL